MLGLQKVKQRVHLGQGFMWAHPRFALVLVCQAWGMGSEVDPPGRWSKEPGRSGSFIVTAGNRTRDPAWQRACSPGWARGGGGGCLLGGVEHLSDPGFAPSVWLGKSDDLSRP